MDTREEQRARWLPDIARVIRSTDFRSAFADTIKGHKQTIIVVLPDDVMAYVFGRLRDWDNAAVVAMPTHTGWSLAVIWPATPERLAVAEEDDALTPVHDGSRADMFFSYLGTVPGPIVVERLAARLVDNRLLAPARC